ncbi:MAG: hypothetical protein ACHQ1H_10890, partial [Nitrososphaerales archaeon]
MRKRSTILRSAISRNRRKRRGIGTVIGTLFFVLIVIIVLGIFVSIFNSFQNYVSVFESYTNQAQQNQQTEFSISSVNFVVPTPTLTGPNALSTSTAASATQYSSEGKVIFAQGLWWSFYSSGAAIVYRTSANGIAWSAATTVTSSSVSTVGYTFSIWLSGTTIYYALANQLNSKSFLWRYGTLNVGGTITWTISETSVSTTAKSSNYISITTDNSGNVWVAFPNTSGNVEVWEYKAGSWSSTDTVAGAVAMILPVTSGVVLIYGTGTTTTNVVSIITSATGSSWSGVVSPASDYALLLSSAYSSGNTVYFAGLASGGSGSGTGTVDFWSFTYGNAATSSQIVVQASVQTWYTSIASAISSTSLIFYGAGTNLYYSYSTDQGAVWSSQQTISTTETSLTGIASSNTGGGILWTSGSSSPYNVRFAFISASSSWQVTSTFQDSSSFAIHFISLYLYDVNTTSLVSHWDTNSSAPGVAGLFDQWAGAGQTISVTLTYNWT